MVAYGISNSEYWAIIQYSYCKTAIRREHTYDRLPIMFAITLLCPVSSNSIFCDEANSFIKTGENCAIFPDCNRGDNCLFDLIV